MMMVHKIHNMTTVPTYEGSLERAQSTISFMQYCEVLSYGRLARFLPGAYLLSFIAITQANLWRCLQKDSEFHIFIRYETC